MKLKFDIKHLNIEYLHKVLCLLSQQYWEKALDEKILFYFDEDTIMIYPMEKGGLDKIFARVQIRISCGNDSFKFCSSYTIKSLREKSAILISPKHLSSFILALKTLINNQYDGNFKLSQQQQQDGTKVQYLEITGTTSSAGISYKD
jgi:hypothetical protein